VKVTDNRVPFFLWDTKDCYTRFGIASSLTLRNDGKMSSQNIGLHPSVLTSSYGGSFIDI